MEKLESAYPHQEEDKEGVKVSLNKINYVEDFTELDEYIKSVGDSEEVGMGDCLQLVKNDYITTFSYGANPCVAGIVLTNQDKLYMFHSAGDELTKEQEEQFQDAKNIIIGGSRVALEKLNVEFKGKNIKTIWPLSDSHDFNIVFVKEKNEFSVKPGLYYCYEESPVSDNFDQLY
jgi:hypothetical protein